MKSINKTILLMSGLFVSSHSYAGIETTLFHQQVEQCMIRITHDATPDSDMGTLVLRIYQLKNAVHENCLSDQTSVNNSIDLALKNYWNNDELKPISSVFIGRLINYPWITENLRNGLFKLDFANRQSEVNSLIFQPEFSAAFVIAIENNDLKATGASCEKILLDENNILIDAMCWLNVSK